MTDLQKSNLMPAALWLANILSVIGISIAGWVLVTVSDLNAQVDVVQSRVETNTKAVQMSVGRIEYEASQVSRMTESADLKMQIRETNSLLREVLERLSRIEGASANR